MPCGKAGSFWAKAESTLSSAWFMSEPQGKSTNISADPRDVAPRAGVKQALMELQMQLELGDIDDAEYVRREAEIMQRLREVRAWRERFGKGTSGGPVRVARDGEPPAGDSGEE